MTDNTLPPRLNVKTAHSDHVPLYHIPQVVALDFDRTIANNAAYMERFYMAAADIPGVSIEGIKLKKRVVEASGETFDPLQYVERVFVSERNRTQYEAFCTRFIEIEEPNVLYDDAVRFLDMLQQADVPHIVLTYGSNIAWQRLKLEAAQYPFSTKVIRHSNKGAEIKKYRHSDGTFQFRVSMGGAAEYVANAMVLIDDKSSAFNEFPEAYPGFKVVRGKELPSQQGQIPNTVRVITSLDELTIIHGMVKIKSEGDPSPDNNFARRLASGVTPDQDMHRATYVPIVS